MKRKVIIWIVAVLVIALLAVGAWHILYDSSKPVSANPENLTIGIPMMLDTSALVYIADDQRCFADNGLNVTIKVYDAGLYAVDDMLDNKNDIAVAAEFVIVGKAFQQEKITGIGSITMSQIHYLIGRKDHGIANVSDLKGKKIGFARNTSGEFYMSRFLELHGISLSDIVPVYVKPSQYVDVIENGTVDAVLAWEPQAITIRDQLGSNAIAWPAQSGQQGYWMAICRDDWAAQHPETIRRFLASIDQAVTYTINHPAEAKAITQKLSGASDEYIATTWANTEFALSLDQSLITAMEDEGRWMINNHLTDQMAIPDYRDYLYPDGLEKIKPDTVNIIT